MKKHTPEEIIRLLREAEASSETAAEFCRRQGISEQTLYRRRQKYGSLDRLIHLTAGPGRVNKRPGRAGARPGETG